MPITINGSTGISGVDGSVGTPAFQGTDPDTGIYIPGAGQVAISTNGTQRLTVDTAATTSTLPVVHPLGAVGTPSITFAGDLNTGIYSPAADTIAFAEGGVEAMRIDSSGRLGLGTSSPSAALDVYADNSTTNLTSLRTTQAYNASPVTYMVLGYKYNVAGAYANGSWISCGKDNTTDGDQKGYLTFGTNNGSTVIERARIDSSGRVGIGTTTPGYPLSIFNSASNFIQFSKTGDAVVGSLIGRANVTDELRIQNSENAPITLSTNNLERARIDSSGRLLIGTSTARSNVNLQSGDRTPQVQIETAVNSYNNGLSIINNSADGYAPQLSLGLSLANSIGSNTNVGPSTSAAIGMINFVGNDGDQFLTGARIESVTDAATGNGDMPCRLVFSTTADGASSPTERMRINARGDVYINQTNAGIASGGAYFYAGGGASDFEVGFSNTRSDGAATVVYVNRQGSDGSLMAFMQASTTEGIISVSGTTVTYGGGHLARWSQLANDEDPSAILKGTVMSNLNEMCEWGEEDNEQLNKTKVSDIEGDPNVAGVFVATSFSEDGPLDFFVGMTGDMIIRIAEGVTVQRGDLLMSAGDGTAKPQDDDIIRSKTVAKVTSTHVTCTYDDGSYCVPCVLMAC